MENLQKVISVFKDFTSGYKKHILPSFNHMKNDKQVQKKIGVYPKSIQKVFYKTLDEKIQEQKNYRNIALFIGIPLCLFHPVGVITSFVGISLFFWYMKNVSLPSLPDKVFRMVTELSNPESEFTENAKYSSYRASRTPRKIPFEIDVANIKLTDLRTGFIFDYNLKTWKVVKHSQFDWRNGNSEWVFKSVSGEENQFIFIKWESGDHFDVFAGKRVNTYAVDNDLDTEIVVHHRPKNVISYKDESFFREEQLEGTVFDLTTNSEGEKIKVWEYFNEDRNKTLRIEQLGQRKFLAFVSERVSDYVFSEILPSAR